MNSEPDQIKDFVVSALTTVQGKGGDYFIFLILGLCLVALYRKLYKMAVGFFILALGTVIVRMLISGLF